MITSITGFKILTTNQYPDKLDRDCALQINAILNALETIFSKEKLSELRQTLADHKGDYTNPHHDTASFVTSDAVIASLYADYQTFVEDYVDETIFIQALFLYVERASADAISTNDEDGKCIESVIFDGYMAEHDSSLTAHPKITTAFTADFYLPKPAFVLMPNLDMGLYVQSLTGEYAPITGLRDMIPATRGTMFLTGHLASDLVTIPMLVWSDSESTDTVTIQKSATVARGLEILIHYNGVDYTIPFTAEATLCCAISFTSAGYVVYWKRNNRIYQTTLAITEYRLNADTCEILCALKHTDTVTSFWDVTFYAHTFTAAEISVLLSSRIP